MKVLLFNFDLQGDLNRALGLPGPTEYKPFVDVMAALSDATDGLGEIDYSQLVRTRRFDVRTGLLSPSQELSLDVIPGDKSMLFIERRKGRGQEATINDSSLLLLFSQPFFKQYDYIFIDASPSWTGMGRPAACAADAIVLPVDTDSFSLEAAKRVISELLYPDDFLAEGMTPPVVEGCIVNPKASTNEALDRIQKTCQGSSPAYLFRYHRLDSG